MDAGEKAEYPCPAGVKTPSDLGNGVQPMSLIQGKSFLSGKLFVSLQNGN